MFDGNEGMEVAEEEKVQAIRANLREKFLKTITGLAGHNCTVQMFEKTNVKCKLATFDPMFENAIVENLETPVPPSLPRAILRMSDIISMQFDLPKPE